ncbi:uncharacterized protein LY89DRAFT_226850 [Mollisia scopiformis]|uniref:Uncharacterized protein n=1 Tax=Mollisia scopiformis TaxID=149040 RepID=A0A194WU84_MOLSC|nr:uncharacterized protein LY89DRAFT_226850 [Mollisia scopiformis]KUJ11520.1 hypothetical protein LY89DRAFT_226850 [Mollisia scopiformis]
MRHWRRMLCRQLHGILRCGNQGATCSSDSECAFNTCISGSCSGTLSSSSAAVSSTPVSTTSVPSSTATAVALGGTCTTSSQCANGASCYSVNSQEVLRCGNQGATCSSDSQCAFNTCVSGSCSGTLSSSSITSGSTSFGSVTTSFKSSSTAPAGGANVTVTSISTGVPAGFTTSVTVVNGVTSSVLVNSAGATTSFGAVATQTITSSTKGSGAGKLAVGFGGMFAVAAGVAMLL